MSKPFPPERHLTQDELLAELVEKFGENPLDWAFTCPACDDTVTGREYRDVLQSAHPDEYGRTVFASNHLGVECVGRHTTSRGCDWAAYGLFRGPWFVTVTDTNEHRGETFPRFPIAEGKP